MYKYPASTWVEIYGNVCAYVRICICACFYVCKSVLSSVILYMCVRVCNYIYIYIYMCVCVYIYIYIRVCVYVCVCVAMSSHMCVRN